VHLQAAGLLLRQGTIVGATIISAPSSTKNSTGERDPEMHQTRKGNQWYFGMKAYVGVDAESDLVHSVICTAANVADVTACAWCIARRRWRSTMPATYGEGQLMADNTTGGDDTLIGGAGPGTFSSLHGDADFMTGNAKGGNDTLIAGNGAPTNYLFGDAFEMDSNARGGNDTLISGTGTDHMWGDAQFINGIAASSTAPTGTVITGADTFVFAPGNGNDDINDFRQSDHDKIDVSAYGFHSLTQMMITEFNGNTQIAFNANDSVTLVGFSDAQALRPSDFVLA